MPCEKCSYQDKKEIEKFGKQLCQICAKFAPESKEQFDSYLAEKLDWKTLDTFRKYGQSIGASQKQGMGKKAKQGKLVTRPPMGYAPADGKLTQNQDASKVHSIFSDFLNQDISLSSLSKKYNLSINGLKKILTNRTYLGEIKFDGNIHKGTHEKLISDEIFYAVQRKLKERLQKSTTAY
ncbi:hypothetical protein CMI37_26320 [Candidatus Pacearchaeota archaeon]|nr:hypothetical protein [Candidatus Pacearchaeota archaeon]|tara:strand:+ start:3802 stop:4341 length:540 start_codon:yes stop_codon:yes gene_type:complete